MIVEPQTRILIGRWAGLVVMTVVLAACEAAAYDADRTVEESAWHINPAHAVGPETSALHVLVEASACTDRAEVTANVSYGSTQIVIATTVLRYGCLTGSGDIPFVLQLSEPIGNRELVDPNAWRARPTERPADNEAEPRR
jgi:hypothetical protein